MTAIDNIEQAIAGLNTERNELKLRYQQKMQGFMKELTKVFFAENPQITAFVWTQYTPYFNDGDSCEFRRGEISATNCPLDEIEEVRYEDYEGETEGVFVSDFSDWTFYSVYQKDTVQAITEAGINVKAVQKFISLLESIDEEVYEEMFGDHVRVVATAQGFDVEEYDHD